jgi:hypothetical protein
MIVETLFPEDTAMAIDPHKRQKKLERRKKKQAAERRELARRSAGGLPARLRESAAAPVLHCCVADDLWSQGIGQVLISRTLKSGEVAFVSFLVDRWCLGVKNVVMNVAPRARYQEKMYDQLARNCTLIPLKPECVRKLVEGAVEYAQDLGLPPYPEYATARLIFGNIPAEDCTEEYEFGKDGKPYFFAGPRDDAARCREVMRSLAERCGPGGYNFTVPGDVMPEALDYQ